MIYFIENVKQLKEALEGFPDDMPIGTLEFYKDTQRAELSETMHMEWIYVNKETLEYVGDEAGDYVPKENEGKALAFTTQEARKYVDRVTTRQ